MDSPPVHLGSAEGIKLIIFQSQCLVGIEMDNGIKQMYEDLLKAKGRGKNVGSVVLPHGSGMPYFVIQKPMEQDKVSTESRENVGIQGVSDS
jgi:hypothetical protein